MTYTLLREFADSWMLLAMMMFFLGCAFWAFRPGSRHLHDEAANLIFVRSDNAAMPRGSVPRPLPGSGSDSGPESGPVFAPSSDAAPDEPQEPTLAAGCGRNCADCACGEIGK